MLFSFSSYGSSYSLEHFRVSCLKLITLPFFTVRGQEGEELSQVWMHQGFSTDTMMSV